MFELPEHSLSALSMILARMGDETVESGDTRPHLLHPTEDAPIAFAFSESERQEFAGLVASALFDISTRNGSGASFCV